ncbi:MAG: aromatic ring-hydroxylating dioxygenase subunit alpha [Hydrococcus sp. C42_A2020_068]|nr:aromatic ring-hydroxylating dioxygenase subunit alpha [Hydrococcus sp. C42_A2020_068]
MDKSNFFLRNIWYYALPSDRLKPGRIVAKTLLNEPILFGRTNMGQVFALRDICPHRAVPLSCGGFDGKEVECAYHGWRFDASGQCSAIPSLTDDQKLNLSRFHVKQYPVREIQGNIWIYMSRGNRAAVSEPEIEIPQVPEFGDRFYQAMEVQRFPCFVDRAVVGLMDPAHVPFVHRAWWWRSDAVLSEEVKAFSPSPYGFTMKRHRLERSTFFYNLIGKNPEVAISFRLPGIRIEQVITENNTVCNLTAITPITETETEVTTIFYTTLPWFALLKPLLLPFIRAFLNQDRQMVIKQQIGLQYDPPLMLIEDADVQARWYYQLKAEFARAISEGRPFSNPVKERVLRWRS